MAKVKVVDPKVTTKKKHSPFKDYQDFEKEIQEFANKYKLIIANQAKKTSTYFEMSCFNYIVRFYELLGYTLTVKNLQAGKYRYKCTPAGIQANFSHFEATIKKNSIDFEYEIHHNLASQSSHDETIFTTPDICIINKGTVKTTKSYYETRTSFSFIENKDLLTFCEVKQFTPFPELLFNFIGVLNELMKEYMANSANDLDPQHLAPTLMISGKPNKQTKRIKDVLEARYCVNIIYDIFFNGAYTFSRGNVRQLRKAGKVPSS